MLSVVDSKSGLLSKALSGSKPSGRQVSKTPVGQSYQKVTYQTEQKAPAQNRVTYKPRKARATLGPNLKLNKKFDTQNTTLTSPNNITQTKLYKQLKMPE